MLFALVELNQPILPGHQPVIVHSSNPCDHLRRHTDDDLGLARAQSGDGAREVPGVSHHTSAPSPRSNGAQRCVPRNLCKWRVESKVAVAQDASVVCCATAHTHTQ